MKENSYDNNMNELDEEKVDYQELFFKYVIHWPWFVASVLACLIGAWVYLHFQTPVYQVSASIMIKDDKKNGGGNVADLESLGLGGVITSAQSIDNEIEVLRSKTILKEVINNLELYITYYDEDEFPKKELYKTSPVVVNLTPQEADELLDVALINMKLTPEGGLDVNLKIGLNEYAKHFDQLPAVLPTDAGTFGFALKDSLANGNIEGQNVVRNISAVVSQPFGVAKGYQWALEIAPTSKTTSVAVVSLMNTNIQRGQDFI
ncbi:Wzz/FepE/Etk N-terminal domain-containing protein, partial [Bacteroides finegoldii]